MHKLRIASGFPRISRNEVAAPVERDREPRIANAADDATYLLADVEVVPTYKLVEINRPRLEGLIHRVLDSVRFDAEIPDRFGKPVRSREWFLVPLPVIEEIVARIGDGTLVDYTYDREKAALVPLA